MKSDFEIFSTTATPHQHWLGTPETLPLPRRDDAAVESPVRLLMVKDGFQIDFRVPSFTKFRFGNFGKRESFYPTLMGPVYSGQNLNSVYGLNICGLVFGFGCKPN